MGTLHLQYGVAKHTDQTSVESLPENVFASFNSSVLGLGQISREAEYQEALAAMFDLEDFTTFCNQIDPHLVIPEYLERFLAWLFRRISDEFTIRKDDGTVLLWARLPFFAKFMGDGVLFLWDTKGMSNTDIGNVVVSLLGICKSYRTEFAKAAKSDFTRVPPRLRCGIARGQVVSVGDKADFVGSCINVAARLQKLGALSFSFARRGFDPARCFDKSHDGKFVTRRVQIRGIGEDELVVVLNDELKKLDPDEAKLFRP